MLLFSADGEFPVVDVHSRAEAAECAVDDAGCWWPAREIRELWSDDMVPLSADEFTRGQDYEWVTISG